MDREDLLHEGRVERRRLADPELLLLVLAGAVQERQRGSGLRSRWRGGAREEPHRGYDDPTAHCFLAGANSIFTGDKLLTTANAGDSADAAMFAKLGLKPMEAAEPMRAMEAAE